jgi:hypothetical protein
MRGFVKMFCGVLVLRAVAAPHVATLQAQSQMHPGVAHFQTLFASLGRFWFYLSYLIQMGAFRHIFTPPANIKLNPGHSLIYGQILHAGNRLSLRW